MAAPSKLYQSVDAIMQNLSQTEKDKLLLQLLQSRQQDTTPPSSGSSGSKPPPTMPVPSHHPSSSVGDTTSQKKKQQEIDILSSQYGIYMSLKEEEAIKKSPPLNIDEEAMTMGIKASRVDYETYCRKLDHAKEMDNVLFEKAKVQSLQGCSSTSEEEQEILEEVTRESLTDTSYIAQEEMATIEEVKRASLTPLSSSSIEEDLIEEAMRESLVCPRLTEEKRIIDSIKRESLLSCSSPSNERMGTEETICSDEEECKMPAQAQAQQDVTEEELDADDDRKMPAQEL